MKNICRWCRGGRGKSAVTPHTTPVPHPFLVRLLSHFDQLAVGLSITVLETCFWQKILIEQCIPVPYCSILSTKHMPTSSQVSTAAQPPGVLPGRGYRRRHSTLDRKYSSFIFVLFFTNVIKKETPVKSEKKKSRLSGNA